MKLEGSTPPACLRLRRNTRVKMQPIRLCDPPLPSPQTPQEPQKGTVQPVPVPLLLLRPLTL